MQAWIYINRHIILANKKASLANGYIIDNAAIRVKTYLGSVYAKQVEFTQGCVLIQNATNPRCSGATIWIEAEFESLIIDGVKASKTMFHLKLVA